MKLVVSDSRYFFIDSDGCEIAVPTEVGKMLTELGVGLQLDVWKDEPGASIVAPLIYLVESDDYENTMFFVAMSLDAVWQELLRRRDTIDELGSFAEKVDIKIKPWRTIVVA